MYVAKITWRIEAKCGMEPDQGAKWEKVMSDSRLTLGIVSSQYEVALTGDILSSRDTVNQYYIGFLLCTRD